MLLMRMKRNKLSATYDPDTYSEVSKKEDQVVIERGETRIKMNVDHVKRFIGPIPQTPQPQHVGMQTVAEPFVQQPVTEPTTLPEPVEVLPQEPVTKPILEPPAQPVFARVPDGAAETHYYSTRTRLNFGDWSTSAHKDSTDPICNSYGYEHHGKGPLSLHLE